MCIKKLYTWIIKYINGINNNFPIQSILVHLKNKFFALNTFIKDNKYKMFEFLVNTFQNITINVDNKSFLLFLFTKNIKI